MSLIIFTQLRTKTFKLFIFIFIGILSFYIPRSINPLIFNALIHLKFRITFFIHEIHP